MATDAKGFPAPPKITKEQKDALQAIYPPMVGTIDLKELTVQRNVVNELRQKHADGEVVDEQVIADVKKKHEKKPPNE